MSALNEKATVSLMKLDDEMLTAVAGGHGRHLGRMRRLRPVFKSTSVTQSNEVGDITVFAPGNKGDVSVSVSQSNSVDL